MEPLINDLLLKRTDYKSLTTNSLQPIQELSTPLLLLPVPYISLSLTNQLSPSPRSVPTQKKQGGAKTVRSKCAALWGRFDSIDKPKYALRQPFEPQNQG